MRPVAACLALLLCAAALISYLAFRPVEPLVYATQFGERRVVTLQDGSRISLDANSQVSVRYTAEARTLELVRGQARFDVAHDTTRRFLVHAGGSTVVATGTAFNVDMMGDELRVTLIEGSVEVTRDDQTTTGPQSNRWHANLRAGQQLTSVARAAPSIQDASLERTTAWERGQLVFEDETLARIGSRVSRYSAQPLVVDQSVAALKISGVFRAGDVDAFVDTVTHYLPVRSTRRADGTVVLTAD
jgi:transmembrane sensor